MFSLLAKALVGPFKAAIKAAWQRAQVEALAEITAELPEAVEVPDAIEDKPKGKRGA